MLLLNVKVDSVTFIYFQENCQTAEMYILPISCYSTQQNDI